MSDQLIAPALLGNNGKVSEKTKTTVIIPLNELDIIKLKSAARISTYIKFNTVPQTQAVQIYKDYKIDVTLSGDFNFNVQ